MSKKKNPKRLPVSKFDLEKAKKEAMDEATEYALTIVFTAMWDYCGMSAEKIQEFYRLVENVSDSLARGYATMAELKYTLRTEAGIVFTKGGGGNGNASVF